MYGHLGGVPALMICIGTLLIICCPQLATIHVNMFRYIDCGHFIELKHLITLTCLTILFMITGTRTAIQFSICNMEVANPTQTTSKHKHVSVQ